ncbi:hypothetical protein L1987_72688 [Smallanthus sonchifolius]|uniref:Uncharacterized protein n=1 Tax=Smallanthus sonchifolius TaxID=185202 RepID=A0ACB9AWM3_9ASTR|nr:hypothetical protein L1987_72688 [Smallanthus sonchifolius]
MKQLSMNFIASHLFFYVFFIPPLLSGADTLVVNQSLSGNQTLVSLAGNFEMGFFRPGKLPNYYIGIWYKKIKRVTIVWVANRETPISDRFSSKLKLKDGNLVLLNESNTPIWSTNMISTDSPASLVLLDDGNLVLRYGSSSSKPIWQSFDHPTHTFLPGSKLGYNKLTNTTQVITSWRNREDPAAGFFSLEIVENKKQYVLKWNRSVEYWASGPWNGQFFSLIPDMRVPYIFNFSYIDNANESYFTYSFYNPSVISRLIIDVSGQVQQLTLDEISEQWYLFWSQPRQICDVYAKCGAFSTCNQQISPFCNCLIGFEPTSQSDWNLSEFSGGCVRKTELKCSVKEEKPEFILSYVPVKFLPAFHENGTPSLDESACRKSCLDDCSCEVYSFIFKTCRLWNSDNLNSVSLEFVSNDSTVEKFELNIKVASKDLLHPIKNSHKKNDKDKGWKDENGRIVGSVYFGLAKLVGRDFSRVLTTMRGTRGYLAPEWLSGVPVTPKADVFSYGMLLFELVYGKRNSEQSQEGSGFTFFPSLAANVVMGGGDVLSLLDDRLNREASVEEVTKICKVAYWCIQDEEDCRPSMSQVEHILEGVVDVNMPPIPQSVKIFLDDTEDVPFLNVSSSIFNDSSSIESPQVWSNSLSVDSHCASS